MGGDGTTPPFPTLGDSREPEVSVSVCTYVCACRSVVTDISVSQRANSVTKDEISNLSLNDAEVLVTAALLHLEVTGWAGERCAFNTRHFLQKKSTQPGLVSQFSTLSECCSRITPWGERSKPPGLRVLLDAPSSPALLQHSLHQETIKNKPVLF